MIQNSTRVDSEAVDSANYQVTVILEILLMKLLTCHDPENSASGGDKNKQQHSHNRCPTFQNPKSWMQIACNQFKMHTNTSIKQLSNNRKNT